jgi:hypothetical protein
LPIVDIVPAGRRDINKISVYGADTRNLASGLAIPDTDINKFYNCRFKI